MAISICYLVPPALVSPEVAAEEHPRPETPQKPGNFCQYLRQNKNTYKKMANSPARNRVLPKLPGFLELDAGVGIVQKTWFLSTSETRFFEKTWFLGFLKKPGFLVF